MNIDIQSYNNLQEEKNKKVCNALANLLDQKLGEENSKIWHKGPVWFIDGNPIAGYWVRKDSVQLLFWSGQSFEETGLTKEGSFKAAEKRFISESEINAADVNRWLDKATKIQWDYKNIVKRKGKLEKIGSW